MMLWCEWWRWCAPLREACPRKRTFLWMCVVLVGFSVRQDLWGVTSMVRALGLTAPCLFSGHGVREVDEGLMSSKNGVLYTVSN